MRERYCFPVVLTFARFSGLQRFMTVFKVKANNEEFKRMQVSSLLGPANTSLRLLGTLKWGGSDVFSASGLRGIMGWIPERNGG